MVAVCVVLFVLLGSKANSSPPAHVIVTTDRGTLSNPQVGDVITRLTKLPNGECDLGKDGITLAVEGVDDAASGNMSVSIDDDCVVTYEGEGKPPATAPGGQTRKATDD
jgi:hypothetical protein